MSVWRGVVDPSFRNPRTPWSVILILNFILNVILNIVLNVVLNVILIAKIIGTWLEVIK